MDDWVKRMAEKMGAKIVAELPGAGRGVLGAVHATHFYRMRMEELRQEQVSSPAEYPPMPGQCKSPISDATAQALVDIANVVEAGVKCIEYLKHAAWDVEYAAMARAERSRQVPADPKDSEQKRSELESTPALVGEAQLEYVRAQAKLKELSHDLSHAELVVRGAFVVLRNAAFAMPAGPDTTMLRQGLALLREALDLLLPANATEAQR